jgi:N-terminal phage replisome organiser (Phage_rep_org_N).
MKWIRLYHQITSSRKINSLPPEGRWLYIALLVLASKSPVRGHLLLSENVPLNEKDFAKEANLSLQSTKKNLSALLSLKLVEMKKVEENLEKSSEKVESFLKLSSKKNQSFSEKSCCFLPDWSEKQKASDISKERVQRHRSKENEDENVTLQSRYTKQDCNGLSEIRIRNQNIDIQNRSESEEREVLDWYQKNFIMLNSTDRRALSFFVEKHGAKKVIDAIDRTKEQQKKGKVRIPFLYLKSILKNEKVKEDAESVLGVEEVEEQWLPLE